jgi:hypothetical protein
VSDLHCIVPDVGSEPFLSSCATGGSETEMAIYDSYWTAGVNGWRVGAGLSRPMEERRVAKYRDTGLPGSSHRRGSGPTRGYRAFPIYSSVSPPVARRGYSFIRSSLDWRDSALQAKKGRNSLVSVAESRRTVVGTEKQKLRRAIT